MNVVSLWGVVVLGVQVLVEEVGEGAADADVAGFALGFEGGGERFVFGGGEGLGAAELGEGRWAEEGFKGSGGGGRGFSGSGWGVVVVGVEESEAFAEA